MSETGRDYWDARIAMTPACAQFHSASEITSPYEGGPLALTLMVTCYNEEATIAATLDTIREAMEVAGHSYEILVIDDASTDASVEKIRAYMAAHPTLAILLRINRENKGLTQNYYDGAFIGRGQYYRLILGDNSEPVETMADVLRTVGEADIIVPYFLSRLKTGSPLSWTSVCYNWCLNAITGNRIHDYTGLHVHLRYNVMRFHSGLRGFSFQADLLCRLLELGFTCKQVPCRAVVRSVNKTTLRSLLRTTRTIIQRRIQR